MFKTIKSWFKPKGMPARKIEEPAISEPVKSFVECVRNNPKNFRCSLNEKTKDYLGLTFHFAIKDLSTKELFSFEQGGGSGWIFNKSTNLSFATSKELDFAYQEIVKIYDKRRERYLKIKSEKQRKRLIGVYCK